MSRPEVIAQIKAELRQRDLDGSSANDELYNLRDWLTSIEHCVAHIRWRPDVARAVLITIAALAVAAAESCDRSSEVDVNEQT